MRLIKLNSLKTGLRNNVPGRISSDNADIDTLQNSLKFLGESMGISGFRKDKLGNATQSVQDQEGKFQQAAEVKSYISSN